MRFAGPLQHNVYFVNNKAFSTAVVKRPAALVQNPDENDPLQLAVQGVIISKLVIFYGPGGWPPETANLLQKHVQEWQAPFNHEYLAQILTEYVLNPFNELFTLDTESDQLSWQNVQWQVPIVEIDEETQWPHIQAKSDDNQFIVDLEFSENHVLVSYCGPLTFNMDIVQPKIPRRFVSRYSFPIRAGGSTSAGAWPLKEAMFLLNIQQDWDEIFNDAQLDENNEHYMQMTEMRQEFVLTATRELLISGFQNLLTMLVSAGQEQQNHNLDQDNWDAQNWQDVTIIDDHFVMRTTDNIYRVSWNFNVENGVVEITCSAPCRFAKKDAAGASSFAP